MKTNHSTIAKIGLAIALSLPFTLAQAQPSAKRAAGRRWRSPCCRRQHRACHGGCVCQRQPRDVKGHQPAGGQNGRTEQTHRGRSS